MKGDKTVNKKQKQSKKVDECASVCMHVCVCVCVCVCVWEREREREMEMLKI